MTSAVFIRRLLCCTLIAALSTVARSERLGVSAQYPAVSPSGREIAFAADFDGRTRIWIAGIDGSRLRKISSVGTSADSSLDSEPTWSPDGAKIAYTSLSGSKSDIWVMQADGAYPVKLTSNGANNTRPAWAPDGRKIAFVSEKDGTKDIWLMNPDGSQQAKLLSSAGEENSPSFSPAGNQIVFSKTDGDVALLMIVNSDGSGLRTLTSGSYRDWEPTWGSRGILFSSNRSDADRWKIWVVQPDGSNLRQLGDVAGHDPAWLPDGRVLLTDESMQSMAISSISALNPATGVKQVIVDVQGYMTPVDIRPGQTPNYVNPRSMGKVQVAVLSTRTFDAPKSVDQKSLTFGRTGAEKSLAFCLKPSIDVNGDGLPDLVCSFESRYAGFRMGDTQGVLRFTDTRGIPFEGRDSVTTVDQTVPDDLRN